MMETYLLYASEKFPKNPLLYLFDPFSAILKKKKSKFAIISINIFVLTFGFLFCYAEKTFVIKHEYRFNNFTIH